tara:strand:+ start:112 stop:531 length:420 start_codon:yes stop_codon:yes gene_type:complete
MLKKLKEKRKKRIASGKYVVGEKLTKAGRERARARKMSKTMKGKIKTVKGMKEGGKSGSAGTVAAKKKAMGIKSKVNKKDLADKGSKLTKAGVFPKYKKESKSGGSFRAAFKKNCSGGSGGTFSWQGRSYSCARADDKK